MNGSHYVMQGTIQDHNWYFYHDTLSLIPVTNMMNWMKETKIGGVSTIKSKWLVPQTV